MTDTGHDEWEAILDSLYLRTQSDLAFGIDRLPREVPSALPREVPSALPREVPSALPRQTFEAAEISGEEEVGPGTAEDTAGTANDETAETARDKAAAAARGAPPATSPERLAEMAREVAACRACGLHATRRHTVFGEGDPDADLLFVGEAPGADEDRTGRPFVGRAGELLTRMIKAMGFNRDQVFIANVLKCRPPNNRTPARDEILACRHVLEEQIRLIAPRVIVALGAPAAKTLLDQKKGINALRGRAHPYSVPGVRIVPTFHPAYLLRNESEKRKAWEDLQLAMSLLREPR